LSPIRQRNPKVWSGAPLERLEHADLTSSIGEDFGAAARTLAAGAEVSPPRHRLWRRAS
jgi:hypothetical protein